jgi:cell division protein FtsW (lipid II flippase)
MPWLIQLINLVAGVIFAILLFPETVSKVYAVATGLLCSTVAVAFYVLLYEWAENKVRSWLGIPPITPQPPQIQPPPPK